MAAGFALVGADLLFLAFALASPFADVARIHMYAYLVTTRVVYGCCYAIWG